MSGAKEEEKWGDVARAKLASWGEMGRAGGRVRRRWLGGWGEGRDGVEGAVGGIPSRLKNHSQ